MDRSEVAGPAIDGRLGGELTVYPSVAAAAAALEAAGTPLAPEVA